MSTSVGGIGLVPTPTTTPTTSQNTVNQDDFIKLFLAQLQFQDPLQPVDNQEFLAQLAQFSNLEQTQQTADNTNGLLVMNSSSQALTLLGRDVAFTASDGSNIPGTVTGITFDSSGPLLTISDSSDAQVHTDIRLSQISTVATTTIPASTTP